MTNLASDPEKAAEILRGKLANGEAWNKFEQMVCFQGGKLPANRLSTAPALPLLADRSGTVKSMDGQKLGLAIIQLGGGRKQSEDSIDHSVGLLMTSRIGSVVERGMPLLEILAPTEKAKAVSPLLLAAFEIEAS
jgi:thymidine phosphorylase